MSKMFEREIEFIRSRFNEDGNIPLHEPRFIGNEKQYLKDVIDSTFVSTVGPYLGRLEQMLCRYTGSAHATVVVNGTAALHAALIAETVDHRCEVITQALTFVATVNAIAYCGAEPLFLDVDKNTLGLSPDALEKFLATQTFQKDGKSFNKDTHKEIRACLPVHIFGHPCRIDEICQICETYNIPVIEDCAESLGSFSKKKHTGLFGRCGTFSFNGNKIVTAGGGGAVITNDGLLAKKIKHLSTTARVNDGQRFIHDEVGYNYRMPNLNAALLCAQMENLEMFVLKKRQLALDYESFFKSSRLTFFPEPEFCTSNYWLNAVVAKDKVMRNQFLTELNDSGVMARPAWRLMNKLVMYRHCQKDSLKNTEWLEDRIINIPSSVIL